MTDRPSEPTAVGIGIIRRGDRFLVRQRPEGTVYAGYWEFPGGKCEPGESPAAATVRECLEETGLAVVPDSLRRTVIHRYPHGLVELFFHDCTTENPTADPMPGTGFRWVPARELSALQFPEANEAILAELTRADVTEPGSGSAGLAARDQRHDRSDRNHAPLRET
jgi:8-oxo-dGTP diphosphatase